MASYSHTPQDHEKDGIMEINVSLLQGVLASEQYPKVHTHMSSDYGDGGELDYLMLDCSNSPLTGNLDMGNNNITNLADPVNSQDAATKNYVDEGTWMLPPIIEWYDPTEGLPEDPEVGDRYGADATAEGWTEGYIYEWDGEEWVETEPEEGFFVWELFAMILWVFFSGGWMEAGEDSYLRLDCSNDPLTGDLDLGTHKIVGVVDPENAQDAATKNYCDTNFISIVGGATEDNFASFDASGEVKDSGSKVADFATAGHNHDSDYISIVGGATDGNLAEFDDAGELVDSGSKVADFAASGHNHDDAYITIIAVPAENHFPYQTAGGELIDSGYDASDFEVAGAAATHSALTTGVHGVTGTVLGTEDVDDTPVNGETTMPISSNWAYDHNLLQKGTHGDGIIQHVTGFPEDADVGDVIIFTTTPFHMYKCTAEYDDKELDIAWYDEAWACRFWVTIPTPISGNKSVLITEDAIPAAAWALMLSDGADIVVCASDGVTKLKRQLISIDTGAETLELYAKAADGYTTLCVYCGNAAGAEVSDFADYESYYETYSARVAASADDVYIQWTGAVWQATLTTSIYQIAGYGAATQQKAGGGMRFLALGIPQYSHACSMTVKFTCNVANANVDVNTRFTGQKSGTPDTFSDLVDYQARRGTVVGGANDDYITTAQVDWDGMAAWVAETEYTSPELKTIAQEVFDNSAVTNMVVFWDDHDARGDQVNGHLRYAYSYNGSAAKAPLLTVNYIPKLALISSALEYQIKDYWDTIVHMPDYPMTEDEWLITRDDEPVLDITTEGIRSYGDLVHTKKIFVASNSPFKRSGVEYQMAFGTVVFVIKNGSDWYITGFADNGGDYNYILGLDSSIGNLDVYLVDLFDNDTFFTTIVTNESWANMKAEFDANYLNGALSSAIANESSTEGVDAFAYTKGAYVFSMPSGWAVATATVATTFVDPPTITSENRTVFGYDKSSNMAYISCIPWASSDDGFAGEFAAGIDSPILRLGSLSIDTSTLLTYYSVADMCMEAYCGALEYGGTLRFKVGYDPSNINELMALDNYGGISRLSFFGVTPAIKQTHISDPSGGGTTDAEARTAINAILDALEAYGLLATS